jgi:hypothetical protein
MLYVARPYRVSPQFAKVILACGRIVVMQLQLVGDELVDRMMDAMFA